LSSSSPTTVEASRSSALAPMQSPVFRSVWVASTVSNLGGMIQSVGAAWMMTSIARSADMVALVQASTALPIVLLALVAGAMADNFDRRRLMVRAQTFLLVVSAALAVCTWFGAITPWLLLTFTFLIGCGSAFTAPAWQASVGDMVPREHLPAAVTLNSMGFNIARSLGPALGGIIVATVGAAGAFAINAVTYIAPIVALSRWRPSVTMQLLPSESLTVAISAGLRYVRMSPAIRTVLIRSAVFGFGGIAVLALLPLIAKHLIGGGPLTYGLMFGSFGVGAVTGALSSARLRQRLSTETMVRLASLSFALALAGAAFSSVLPATMLALFVTGAGWVLALSTFNVGVQLSAPRWVVARALAMYQVAAFAGMAAGSWLWGVIAENSGLSAALLAAAAAMMVCALLGLVLPMVQTEHLNLDPLRTWHEPSTAVPVEGRSGPVVVTIEYIIDEADILEFLAAMAERRRIRRRDGARNWTLSRDLADPRLWIERYNTPTWLDYIRHNNRLTQHDAVVPTRLRALHRGESPPVVRRMLERQPSALPSGDPAPHGVADH
jgi:MFS family permease